MFYGYEDDNLIEGNFKITPKTKSTYTYKSEYLGRETTIDVAFGGENKKKARKLKKYNP